jgi:hypothetical protein
MKISKVLAACVATFVNSNTVGTTEDRALSSQRNLADEMSERRYAQFQEVFLHYFNHDQLMQLYGYGCYCLNLGDRPLSGIMTGVDPVDPKDEVCYNFTKCNRCVTFDYGDECTPEQTDYKFEMVEDEMVCTDQEDTCSHAICECDKETIIQLKDKIDYYEADKHQFNGFRPEYECVMKQVKDEHHQGIPHQLNCCGSYPNRNPYNDKLKVCCDGKVTPQNTCGSSSFN